MPGLHEGLSDVQVGVLAVIAVVIIPYKTGIIRASGYAQAEVDGALRDLTNRNLVWDMGNGSYRLVHAATGEWLRTHHANLLAATRRKLEG